jgi:hypothetical protein
MQINLLQNSLEKEIKNLEADISSLDSIHVAENSKYHTEMQKIQSHDKHFMLVVSFRNTDWTCILATLLTEKTA